jgi:acetyl-CoA carboxylase biotin carboxyl carrier protein
MDLKEIRQLITMVEKANISHFSIENEGSKIEIKKEATMPSQQISTISIPTQTIDPASIPQQITQETPSAKIETEETPDNLVAIKAEMVGTFYASPNPESPAYANVGDKISKNQVICILEAMKLFNEIESEISGTVEKICVENGTPVEFGQELFLIRP